MENDALVTEKAGLPVKEDPKLHRVLIAVEGFACDICCSDEVNDCDSWSFLLINILSSLIFLPIHWRAMIGFAKTATNNTLQSRLLKTANLVI